MWIIAVALAVLASVILAGRFTRRRSLERLVFLAVVEAVIGGVFHLAGAHRAGWALLQISGFLVAILAGLLLSRIASARG
jgi:hypothetical protein